MVEGEPSGFAGLTIDRCVAYRHGHDKHPCRIDHQQGFGSALGLAKTTGLPAQENIHLVKRLSHSNPEAHPSQHAPCHPINCRPSAQSLCAIAAKAAFSDQAPQGDELLGVHAQKMRRPDVLVQMPAHQWQTLARGRLMAAQHEATDGGQDEGEDQAHHHAPCGDRQALGATR